MARLDGHVARVLITVLILITTLAGVFAGMLSLSRVPFAAAPDNRFFRIFAQTHPTGGFPTFAVAYVGVASAACCVLDLDQVVKALSVAGQGNRVKK
jgi:amino acid transporter